MFEYVSLYCHDQMVSKRDDVTGRKIIAAEFSCVGMNGGASLCHDPFYLRRWGSTVYAAHC